MGLPTASILHMLSEAKKRPFSGKALVLGRAIIGVTQSELVDLAQLKEFRLIDGEYGFSHNPGAAKKHLISDTYFFETIGFDAMESLDVFDYENPTHVHNLGDPNLPDNLIAQFESVIDVGTLEHVFNIPVALNNIFRMLKVNGRAIFHVASTNYIDHGYYMFSPILFWDYFIFNKWEVNSLYLVACDPDKSHREYQSIELKNRRELKDILVEQKLLDCPYEIYCVVTKTEQSTGHKEPRQLDSISGPGL